MALKNTTDLAIAELAIYLLIIPFTFWLLMKHGRRGLLAYVYLLAFEILRVVSACMQISERNDLYPSIAAAIVNSVGLSPLLLAYAGFIHELKEHYAPSNRPRWLVRVEELAVHASAVTGIALAATGGANLASSNNTPSDISSAHTLQEVGATLLLLTWAALMGLCLLLFRKLRSVPILGFLMVAAGVFIGARAIYTMVYAFDHSPNLNVVTGSFVIKLILLFLVQLLAALMLLAVGFLTRDVVGQYDSRPRTAGRRARDVEYRGDSLPLRSPASK